MHPKFVLFISRSCALLAFSLSLAGCSPPKEAEIRSLEIQQPAASQESALSPRPAARLRQLVEIYAPEQGYSRADAKSLFQKFQPAFVPVVEQAFSDETSRLSGPALWARMGELLPPLAWVEKTDLTTEAGLRAGLAQAYPGITPVAVDEIAKRLTVDGLTDLKKIVRAGVAIGAMNLAGTSIQPSLRKITALYNGEGDTLWAAAVLGTVIAFAEAPKVDQNDKRISRLIHRAIFAQIEFPSHFQWSREQIEQFDWNLDTALATREDGAFIRGARASFGRALPRLRDGEEALRKPTRDERLQTWQVLAATEAMLTLCEIDTAATFSEYELTSILVAGSREKGKAAVCGKVSARFAPAPALPPPDLELPPGP